MNCINCGSYVPDGQAFCGNCGTPVSSNDAAPIVRRGTSAFAKQLGNTQEVQEQPETAPVTQAPDSNPDIQSIENTVNTQQPVASVFAQQPEPSPFAQPAANTPFAQQPTASPFAQPTTTSSPFAQQTENSSFAQPIQPVYQKNADPQSFNQQPVFQQPAYQQPAYQQPTNYTPESLTETKPKKSHGMSIAALVLSISGILFCWVRNLNIFITLPALIFSIIGIARKNSDKVRSIIALCIAIPTFLISCGVNSLYKNRKEKSTSQTETNVIAESENAIEESENVTAESESETTTVASESEKALPFNVSSETTKLQVGEIAKDGDFYYGLSCVRSLDRVQTAISTYSEEISDSQEVIYPIIEVYNNGNKARTFNKSNISVYTDSVKSADPDTIYLVGVDGIEQLQTYAIDPERTALVIDAFVVDKGWSELTVFCGDVSWTLTPDSISYDTYSFKSLYNLTPEYAFTEAGSKIYEEKYELIFDGMEIYVYENSLIGDETYAVFEFTINNTSDSALDYSTVGYSMKGYWNTQLLDDATYIMDDTINGYTNVYDIDEVHAGMTAKVYVAFEIPDESGVFECIYDTGYIISDRIAYVCFNNDISGIEDESYEEE